MSYTHTHMVKCKMMISCLLNGSHTHTHTGSNGDDDILSDDDDTDLANQIVCDSDRTMKTASMVLANANLWF